MELDCMLFKNKSVLISFFSLLLLFMITAVLINSPFFFNQPIQKKDKHIIQRITTDKALYHPNETIHFKTQLVDKYSGGTLNIQYYHLNTIIFKQKIKIIKNQAQWTWKAPNKDFEGYLVQVQYESKTEQDHQET